MLKKSILLVFCRFPSILLYCSIPEESEPFSYYLVGNATFTHSRLFFLTRRIMENALDIFIYFILLYFGIAYFLIRWCFKKKIHSHLQGIWSSLLPFCIRPRVDFCKFRLGSSETYNLLKSCVFVLPNKFSATLCFLSNF